MIRKALRLEETCLKCGSHLIIKEGEHGDFLACPKFPSCKFTKSLPDDDLKIYQKPSPYCERCNHTGLIPFRNKGGKLIPNTFLYCDCHEINEYEHYREIGPEGFDFPCSYVWRAYYEETVFGRYLPALEPKELPPEADKVEPQWAKRQWSIVNQLRGMVQFLYSKETERRAKASKRKTYTIK